LDELPQTPRARQAIEFAGEEARNVNQRQIGAEHLLLGLLREPDGVAGQVLRNLGLQLEELRQQVLKVRILQMMIVERAVRPVRASAGRKRKMREELLGHLTEIYDAELGRLHNPDAALEATARRFGDPAELARELETALPRHERISHFVERWFAWRAPESAARYSMRLARQSFYVLAVVLGLIGTGLLLRYGWVEGVRTTWRIFFALLLLAPFAQWLVNLLYFKMRDAMWGAFGSQKSRFHVLLCDASIGLTVIASFYVLVGMATWDWGRHVQELEIYGTVGLLAALIWLVLARFSGPVEIRDSRWALLDIGGAASDTSVPPLGGDSAAELA
jgi:ATP-dependent Clp protease ATP-binding subunit ClpC